MYLKLSDVHQHPSQKFHSWMRCQQLGYTTISHCANTQSTSSLPHLLVDSLSSRTNISHCANTQSTSFFPHLLVDDPSDDTPPCIAGGCMSAWFVAAIIRFYGAYGMPLCVYIRSRHKLFQLSPEIRFIGFKTAIC